MMVRRKIPDAPFTFADAAALGIRRHELDAMVANGEVRRVLTGVYQRADIPDTVENRALAAAKVVSPHAVITDRTAAWIHGVDTLEYHELEILPPLEVFVLRGHSRVTRRGCEGGRRDLAPRDICVIAGVKLTTPLRTALDLGCRLPRRDALAALDGFMRVCGVTREQMLAELPRYFRRRGVVQLRQLVPLADPRAESPGESWVRISIVDAGLPAPEPQCSVHDEYGEPVFRLDLAYPLSKVSIEYDGREYHQSLQRREHDRLRREWLEQRGWTVIVVCKDDFTPEALASWLGELRTGLRVRT
jgi:hypothetical protein